MKLDHLLIILYIILFPLAMHAQSFTEVSQSIGISHIHSDRIYTGGGAAFFDYDNDGHEDIFMTGGRESDRLYHNNGDGTFTDLISGSGLEKPDSMASNGVAIGDINNDGCKDVFIATIKNVQGFGLEHSHNLLFVNNCDGSFTDITVSAGFTDAINWGIGATMGDVNMDGWLDIYTINYIEVGSEGEDSLGNFIFNHVPQYNELYINNGNNTFTNQATLYGVEDYGCGLAATFSDFDGDRDVDLFMVNDFGQFVEPSALYRNDYPIDDMTDISDVSGFNSAIYGMGIAIGDYDEDGDLDYYECNWAPNILHQNQGDGTFIDKAAEMDMENEWVIINNETTVSWGAFFGDFNNNSYLDLFVANGFMPSDDPVPLAGILNYDAFYQNQGNGTFLNFANVLGINNEWAARGTAMGDYDSDGDLDMAVAIIDGLNQLYDTINDPPHNLIYRNNTDGDKNWIGFELQGTDIIRDAYGSLVEIYVDGRKLIREVDGGSSHASHNSSRVHFGLGNNTEVDSVRFLWLGGMDEVIWNPTINTYHHIVQGEQFDPVSNINLLANFSSNIYPNIISNIVNVEMDLPKKANVHFTIFDNAGRLVKDLGNQELLEGRQTIHFDGLQGLASGTYYLKLDISGRVTAHKMMVLR